MNIVKRILSAIFWLLIIALLIAPLGLIAEISRQEMQEFATPSAPVLQEVAIGGIYQSIADSASESFKVSGNLPVHCRQRVGKLQGQRHLRVQCRWLYGAGV